MKRKKGVTAKEYVQKQVAMTTREFQDHKIRERSDGRWILQSRYPDGSRWWSWTFAAEIICLRERAIFVGGDIGPMVFSYGPADFNARIRWIGYHNDLNYYVRQKAHIGTRGKLSERWDPGVAINGLDDLIQERLDEHHPDIGPDLDPGEQELDALRNPLCAAIEGVKMYVHEGPDETYRQLMDVAGEWLDGSDLPDLGWVVHPDVICAWAALRKLCSLLDEEEALSGLTEKENDGGE